MNQNTIGLALLRYGLAAVFVWFGFMEVSNPSGWVSYIPSWVTAFSGLSAHTFVIINGIVELVLAFALIFNIFTWIAAALLSLHLLFIVFDVGLGAVGVRDVGLMISLLALSFLSYEGKTFSKFIS